MGRKWWAYVDEDRDGNFTQVRMIPGGKTLTTWQLRKARKKARDEGWGFRAKRVTKKKDAQKSVRLRALDIARGKIGLAEHPPKSNTCEITQWYGMNGQPWCAMFCSYAYSKAGRPLRYAFVPYVVNDAIAKRGGLSITKKPQPGDLVCFDWDGGVEDHIGLFEKWNSDGSFTAIEGNTSYIDNSNGGEVMRRTRYRSQVGAFVRVS